MILVTGATGQIGKMVVENVLKRGLPVRAFVRDEQALHDINHSKLEKAVGTFEDIKSLELAMDGVDRLFLVARDNPDQVAQHENVLKAAERTGVKHIVKLSAYGASEDSPIALMRWHAETEKQLQDANLDWTFLRPHLYMQNVLRFGEAIAKEGEFSAPMGNDQFSFIDVRDIAEVAAKILRTDGHEGKIYTLTGPFVVSYTEIAEYLSAIRGKSVKYNAVTQEVFYQQHLSKGTPQWRAYDLAYITDAYPGKRKERVTNDVYEILGRPARSLDTFFSDYQESFK
ncbi:SDR family oxidoreductase [Virgibacillus kimchii]